MPGREYDADSARHELTRVLQSTGFARNERLAAFLRFVVEEHLAGRDAEIKESTIAVEVFGRGTDHDPKHDSIVRNEAARLRARLRGYYAEEGKDDSLIIELPKGGYAPVLRIPEMAAAMAATKPEAANRRWLWGAIAVVLIATLGIGWWRIARPTSVSIAVLPLANVSQDSAYEFFADGLTDEIIHNLSIIDGLAVRSQTSSFIFKGRPGNIRDAGKQLDVDYILEGSVLRTDHRLRIDAQLIRVRDDLPLWSGRYDRPLIDAVAIQDEISRGIVNSLRLKLGRGRRRYELSTEVYDLYLRARALSIGDGIRGINQSIQPLEEVVAKDPSFAPAYADLASAYAVRSGEFQFEAQDEVAKMHAAAEKAVELDPLLGPAYSARAIMLARDAQWQESEKTFRRALELDPNQAFTHRDFALMLLWPLGRIAEATKELRAAEKADPLSAEAHVLLAILLNSAGRYRDAAVECQLAPLDQPQRSWALSTAMIGQGKVQEAIQVLEADYHHGLTPGSQVWGELGYAYARAGRRRDAEQLAVVMPQRNPFNQAVLFAGLNDQDRVFEALDRATSRGPAHFGRAITWPELAALRGNPRMTGLRKKVGLPD